MQKKTPYDLAVEEKHVKMAYLLNRALDLYSWLEELGMEKYKIVFIKEEMYKDLLTELDEKILDRMGITITGHRLKLLKAAKTLKEQFLEREKKKQQEQQQAIASPDNNNNSNNNNIASQSTASQSTGIDNKSNNSSSTPSSSSSASTSSAATASTASSPSSFSSSSSSPSLLEQIGRSDIKPVDIEQELEQLKYINKSGTWIIHNSELEFAVKLGSGASGTVYKGLYKGKEVAIKVLKTEQTSKEIDEFKKEFQIMRYVEEIHMLIEILL